MSTTAKQRIQSLDRGLQILEYVADQDQPVRLAELAEQCKEIEREQLAFDDTECRENMNCLASPVYDFRGQVIAAIGISGPVERVNKTTMKDMGQVVTECAADLSAELGYQGRSP